MATLLELLRQYGLTLVFATVLLSQAGVPLPAYPVLILAGSLAAAGQLSGIGAWGCALLASLLADVAWYRGGQRYGGRVLRQVCRLSLTPATCVRQTESIFERWGAKSLMVAKFIPGFASIATAMAGATGVRALPFLGYDAIGALLWSGVGIGLGALFAPAVVQVMAALHALGFWGLALIGVALLAYIAHRLWRRWQFRTLLRIDRVSVESLQEMLNGDPVPLVVDVRSPTEQAEGRIPGALGFDPKAWPKALETADRDRPVVVYCDCPDEASAALFARQLVSRGFRQATPLAGGLHAWRSAGLPVEAMPLPA